MKRLTLIELLLISIAFTSCNQLKLSDSHAQKLIIAKLNLPKKCVININIYGNQELYSLKQQGLISDYGIDNWNESQNYIKLNDSYKEYYLGKNNRQDYVFKSFDIDFDKIDGISINKENNTATVRFLLRFTNISPFGRFESHYTNKDGSGYGININNPINVEFSFRKFDSGWQIETSQNDPNITLLDWVIETNCRR